MPAKIKNCGLKTPESIDQAIATGADFVGFVHYPASPRHLELAAIKPLLEYARGRIKTVIVTSAPDDALIKIIHGFAPDYLQVHKVDPDRATAIAAQSKLKLIFGIGVRSPRDVAIAKSLESKCEYLLLDNHQSGSGQSFDWTLLENLALKKYWFLAGGLTADNVAKALRLTRAPMVDVSSGIEEPIGSGNKSLEKIAAFNKAVLQPSHG